jgi:uncharacterized protein with GYD domain
MPRYMLLAEYTFEGLQGLLKEGGTGRRKAVETLVSSLGGHLETMHYAFGETDVFVTCELPDDEAAAAASLRVAASGMANTRVVKLLDPSQIDAAVDRQLEYRAPGT